jgi:hypothetical protein
MNRGIGMRSGAEMECSQMMVVESFGDHSARECSDSKDLSFGKKSQIRDMK